MTRAELLRHKIAEQESLWRHHHDQALRLARDVATLRAELAAAEQEEADR